MSNEAQTRKFLIDEMLEALGYDTKNFRVCAIEDKAGFQGKGGKKVDYSLSKNGNLVLIVEAKAFGNSLDKETTSQLNEYYTNKLKSNRNFIALSTNGLEYNFFADLDDDNILDDRPFFTFNLKHYTPKDLEIFKMFSYDRIDGKKIKEWGRENKNSQKIFEVIEKEIANPSLNIVKFILKRSGFVANKTNIEKYTPEIKKAFEEILNTNTCTDEFIDKKFQNTQKLVENLTSKQRGKVQDFWEKAIIDVLSSSSEALKAKEIWEKIQKKYSKKEIPTTSSNPVKSVFEECSYRIENIKPVGKNPSKFTLKVTSWTEQEVLERYNDDIVKMYRDVKTDIMKIGNISINPTKNYISFKANGKNFVGFYFQQSKIRVFFTPRVSEFSDPDRKLIDTSSKNTGNGNTEFYYENSQEKDYLLSLIKQSYSKCKG